MRKDFKNLDIYAAFQPANGAEWQKANGISADWNTPEHIDVKPVYTKEDLEGMEHLGYAAGLPPYLRGPYSVMYTLGRARRERLIFPKEPFSVWCSLSKASLMICIVS